MRRLLLALITVALAATACGGGGDAQPADERAWCLDNLDIVEDAADDLGLMDFVDAWYETEGDGIGPDGEPVPTDRNIEVSEDLHARNDADPDQLVDDLWANYLDHPDGVKACAAAYAEEG